MKQIQVIEGKVVAPEEMCIRDSGRPKWCRKNNGSEYSWRYGYGKLWSSDRRWKRYCTVFTETIDSI